jgi:Cu2+-exporting ATPase
MTHAPTTCFHCGESLGGRLLWANLKEAEVPVCCIGCCAAAQLIAQFGLEDFYRFRTAVSLTPQESATEWLHFDEPEQFHSLTSANPAGRSAVMLIDGLTCAACSWLIGRSLEQVEGVVRASVNTATGRASIVWDEGKVALSRLLQVIAGLGYRPHIVTAEAAAAQARVESRAILQRLAVTGLGMMQVMMFAVAMYAGEMQGMDSTTRTYLRLVSMLVATPVMLYGGWPFFVGACKALRMHSVTMDVPVSLGLLLAFGASVLNTWRHAGDVYFDSVTMFIFFLTVARYVEMVARHRSNSVTDALGRIMPDTAHRLRLSDPEPVITDVTVTQLRVGDELLVRCGEMIPADGEITLGSTRVDESMLNGEPLPIPRSRGDRVAAGTLNLGEPVHMRVSATGGATVLASIVALLRRAQAERPRITRAGDAMAGRFLMRVLAGAVVVCAFWLVVEPSRAFAATLAVLVVACPCAFSLATLVAVASANAALARRGVLVTHPDAIEGLAKVTRVVFDKTGTLTTGRVSVTGCEAAGTVSEPECRRIAAALEAASEHPIARAFGCDAAAPLVATDVKVTVGAGIEGCIEGHRYRIGAASFVGGGSLEDDGRILLGCETEVLARFAIGDTVRVESANTVAALRRRGLGAEILSGDAGNAVRRVARSCGITGFLARQSPDDKLQHVNALTARGEFIAMVGDGMNDAPVLGGAGVSIAMSRGSALTLASADLILVGDSLRALPAAFDLARRAKRIIRQNLIWAAAYNLTAMPLAALGWVPPWVAAIGMSASSIVVVLNSLRLMRGDPSQPAADIQRLAEPTSPTPFAPHPGSPGRRGGAAPHPGAVAP